ncbi:MAG: exosortase/archaeosortase family protein [Candidatus Heimdallarchaeota archaeon]|nr:MAG: exosortase/archaeosortase family protein [Candidatus Heimdallarchaeota archaeon]
MVMKTPIVVFLTELTSLNLLFLIKYGSSIPLIILICSFCVFLSLEKTKLKNVSMHFSLFTFFLVLIGGVMLNGISQYDVSSIDVTTLQFESFDNISRITIIDSCSGIYGLLIFISSFIVFANVTRVNRSFNGSQVILSGVLGVIGIYLVNLFRILILVCISLYLPTMLWDELHIYLGAVCVLCYLSFFWAIIWSILPVHSPS